MTTPEAFAAIALAAVACDGKLGRDEAHALRCQLEYRSLYSECSEAAMGELFDRLLLLLRDQAFRDDYSALPQLNGNSSSPPLPLQHISSMPIARSRQRKPTSWISSRVKCRCRRTKPHGCRSN